MLQATQERTVIVSGSPGAVSLAVRALYEKLMALPLDARYQAVDGLMTQLPQEKARRALAASAHARAHTTRACAQS